MKTRIFIARVVLVFVVLMLLSACCEDNSFQSGQTIKEEKPVHTQVAEQPFKTDDPEKRAEKKFRKKYYTFDLNKDGKVTREEFLERSHAEFKEKDKNHDHMIDKEECPGFAMLNPEGNPVNEDTYVKLRGERFDDMDKDHDGMISEKDFVDFKMDFLKRSKEKRLAK